MRGEPRCERIQVEEWVAPGRSNNPLPPQHREMQARCVLGVGHVLSENESERRHIYGDWMERKRG